MKRFIKVIWNKHFYLIKRQPAECYAIGGDDKEMSFLDDVSKVLVNIISVFLYIGGGELIESRATRILQCQSQRLEFMCHI